MSDEERRIKIQEDLNKIADENADIIKSITWDIDWRDK